MMLALETTGRSVSAAIAGAAGVRSLALAERAPAASESLLALVDRVLGEAGVEGRELESVVVDRGPGSFTGIRIGLATARSLGIGWGKPVSTVTATEAWFATVEKAGMPTFVAIDARRGQHYAQWFAPGPAGTWNRSELFVSEPALVDEQLSGLEQFGRSLALAGDPGEGVEAALRAKGFDVRVRGPRRLDAAAVARATALGLGSSHLDPLYVRPPDAREPRVEGAATTAQEGAGAEARRSIDVRPMNVFDLPGVVIVDAGAFSTRWSEESLGAELAREEARTFSFVALEQGAINGYVLAFHVAGEVHIVRIGVLPATRRRGIARALMARVEEEALRTHARSIWLEVRAGNVAARSLYAGLAFEEAGVRRGYYDDANGSEDAVVLVRWL